MLLESSRQVRAKSSRVCDREECERIRYVSLGMCLSDLISDSTGFRKEKRSNGMNPFKSSLETCAL